MLQQITIIQQYLFLQVENYQRNYQTTTYNCIQRQLTKSALYSNLLMHFVLQRH